MSKGKDSKNNIGKITIQLDSLYKSKPTLDYIKRLEEDRKALLSIHNLSASWKEPSVQEKLEDMRKALGYPELQDAFKSYKDYAAVTTPLISALEKDNAKSLLEAFKLDTEPYLKSTYAQTLKATNLFSETLQNVSALGLNNAPDYSKKVHEAIKLYEDNFHLGNKKLVELVTSFENDAFKKSFELANSFQKTAPHISTLDSLEKSKGTFKSLTEPKIPKVELPEIPHFKPPRPEDSPHYKQNEKILKNSEEQISLLKQVSIYMSSQSEKLEFLNDLTAKQVEENKITSDKQSEINARASKSAMRVAIISIIITLLFSVGGLVLSYYIFIQEDISDNKDHAEVVQLLKDNNLNGVLHELVDQLKINKHNDSELERVKRENKSMNIKSKDQKLK